MSEYQFYDFRAIDKPLTSEQMDELRQLTSRAEITPASLTNEYHYGDFRGDEYKLLTTHFDAFYYYAIWGTERLLLRLPSGALDRQTCRAYLAEGCLEIKSVKSGVIIEFARESEDYADDDEYRSEEDDFYLPETDGDSHLQQADLSTLIPIRAQLLMGDSRALYIGWLSAARRLIKGGRAPEPPVPAGLQSLDVSLTALARMLRVPPELVAAAAERSEGLPTPLGKQEYASFFQKQTEAQRLDWLVALMDDETGQLRRSIWRHIASELPRPGVASERAPRTAGELLQRAAELRAEAEEAKKKRLEAQRKKQLREIASREPLVWKEVEKLLESKSYRDHERAVKLLIGLRDMGLQERRSAEVQLRLDSLHQRNFKRTALMKRFRDAGLTR